MKNRHLIFQKIRRKVEQRSVGAGTGASSQRERGGEGSTGDYMRCRSSRLEVFCKSYLVKFCKIHRKTGKHLLSVTFT